MYTYPSCILCTSYIFLIKMYNRYSLIFNFNFYVGCCCSLHDLRIPIILFYTHSYVPLIHFFKKMYDRYSLVFNFKFYIGYYRSFGDLRVPIYIVFIYSDMLLFMFLWNLSSLFSRFIYLSIRYEYLVFYVTAILQSERFNEIFKFR